MVKIAERRTEAPPAANPPRDLRKGMRAFTPPGMEDALELPAPPAQGAEGFAAGFVYPAVLRGSTAHFNVYYDPALGANGAACADAVLSDCEQDFATLVATFGITPGGLPFNIIIAPLDPSGNGNGGAFHFGCSAVDLYCDIKTVPALAVEYTKLLVIAEEVEVFQAAQALGWNCGGSNGEGLSRVLAEVMHPAGILPWMYTAPTWLDSATRPDYLSVTDPTDRNYLSTGCATLFLYYLRRQLDFTWPEIVQAGGSTLEQTYQALVGQPGAYAAFTSLLQSFYPIGHPSHLTTDDPFPLARRAHFPICGVQFNGTVPAGATWTWYTWGWPDLWRVVWMIVPTNVGPTGPQLDWNVSVQKSPGGSLIYFIAITNLTASPVDVEARYSILCGH